MAAPPDGKWVVHLTTIFGQLSCLKQWWYTFFRIRLRRPTVNASEKPTRCSLGEASSIHLVNSPSGRIRLAHFNPCDSILIEIYQPKWITYSTWLTWQPVWSSSAHLWFDLHPAKVAKTQFTLHLLFLIEFFPSSFPCSKPFLIQIRVIFTEFYLKSASSLI